VPTELQLHWLDIIIFVLFAGTVVFIGLWMSRGERNSEDYFLAGRGLTWPLIGFSLIAANISAEQFVGMSGSAAKDSIGLAVASYEWVAAITLVVFAFFFLPKFLRSGIYTIPEYLEHRYSHWARLIMSVLMLVILVMVNIAAVVFMGAKALEPLIPGVGIAGLCWGVGIAAAIYVFAGGLKACAWADLIQGSALIVGGAVVMVLAFMALSNPEGWAGTNSSEAVAQSLGVAQDAGLGERLGALKEEKMHMVLPWDAGFLPWTALLIGIWIPNVYYWGLNQYIVQRTLGSKNVSEGQKGAVFAAGMKLVIPFIVCVPGIIAFTLYSEPMAENAMQNKQKNGNVLKQFDQLQANPGDTVQVFPFNADFAELQPDYSQKIIRFNAQVTGVDVTEQQLAGAAAATASEGEAEGPTLTALNKQVLANAPKEPYWFMTMLGLSERPEKVYNHQQGLIGYDYDAAYPLLIRYLTPVGLRGFVLAALMGAVVSSLASMLNGASTIFTMDLFREWAGSNASQSTLVWVGRTAVAICAGVGTFLAYWIVTDPGFKGAFAYIQEFQGFISPGVLTIFIFGLFIWPTPRICGVLGLVLSPIVYGSLFILKNLDGFYMNMIFDSFLNRMAITVAVIALVLGIVTALNPLREPIPAPHHTEMSLQSSTGAKWLGVLVVVLTVLLYIVFW
jgi:SSS family solute:Na+ symporter